MVDRSPAVPHVLMTRFNLATPGREAAIRNKPDWLATRFRLFEAFCLPSVAEQSTRDFTWIIYFDKDTPQAFKDRVADLQKAVPFEAYYTGLFPASGWPQSLTEVLGARLGAVPPVVLTSRLDNDDALARDYMERTAAAAVGQVAAPRVGIVITNGYIRSATSAYRISHPCNAFASWLERVDQQGGPLTAMGISHVDAADFGPLLQVPGPGGWLQVVHGGNVSNKVRGVRVGPDGLAARFPVGALAGLQPATGLALAADNLVLSPLRSWRDRLYGLARKVKRLKG